MHFVTIWITVEVKACLAFDSQSSQGKEFTLSKPIALGIDVFVGSSEENHCKRKLPTILID